MPLAQQCQTDKTPDPCRLRALKFAYRIPWSVGVVCSFYLMIGLMVAGTASGHAAGDWMDGSYPGSFIAASILLQSSIIAGILFCVRGLRKPDWPGLCLLPLFAFVVWMFSYCFLDKVKGYVLWPWINH